MHTLEQIRAAMTKKQQEALDAQLARETRTRDELLRLEALVGRVGDVLVRVVRGNAREAKVKPNLFLK